MLLEDVAIAINHGKSGSMQPARLRGARNRAPPHLADPNHLCRETQQIVARVFQVSPVQLRQRSRGLADAALARQAAMYLANVAGGVSFKDVGRGFGRNRSTVAYACGRIEDLRDDPRLDLSLSLLEGALRSTFRMPDLRRTSPATGHSS
jgi:Bacterial dnaA protein helix-turn-helix